jgi:hypothetical protein
VTHLALRWSTPRGPTTRPRHVITETEALAAVLDEAAAHWPEDAGSRSRLPFQLIEIGRAQLVNERQREIEERRRAIRGPATRGRARFPAGYLEDLRRDWTE